MGAAIAEARAGAANVVIVDSDYEGESYLDGLRQAGLFVCAVEDLAEHPFPAHMVLNGDAHAAMLDYRSSTGDTRFLLGPQYALLGPEYRRHPAPAARVPAERILVSLGGSDAHGLLPAVVRALDRLPVSIALTVSVGPFARSRGEVEAMAARLRRPAEVVVGPASLHSLIASADLVVTAAGQTLNELARLGRPAVAIEVARNQHEQVLAFVEAETVRLAGNAREPDIEERVLEAVAALLGAPQEMIAMAAAGPRFIDGHGAERAADALLLAAAESQVRARP